MGAIEPGLGSAACHRWRIAAHPDGADGVVLNCWGDADAAAEAVETTVNAGRDGLRVVAGVLGALYLLFRPLRARQPHTERDWDHARDIIRGYGADTLAYFALRGTSTE